MKQGYYRNNLNMIKEVAIPNKWDALAVFFGSEGSGKSTLAMQSAAYLDPDFCLDKVVFTPKQFEEAIDNAEPGSCIVWDEAITGANVQKFASKMSIEIISKLTQIRKKRLIIFLCFPYLWMLNKYYLSRNLFICYVYAKSFIDRGYAKFYNSKKASILYWYMKEKYPYYPELAIKKVYPDFHEIFNGKFPLDEALYDEKKEKSRVEDEEEDSNIWKIRAISLIKDLELPRKDVAKIWGLSTQYIHDLVSRT